MEIVCLECGSKGWENAFVYCVKCLDCAVHRYCLPVIPETMDEFVHWLCEDCEVEPQAQSTADEQKENDTMAAETEEGLYEDGPCEPYDAHMELDLVKSNESANQHSPIQLERSNKKRAITCGENERKRTKGGSSHQLLTGVFLKDILKRKKRNKNRNRRNRNRKRNKNRLLYNGSLESPKNKLVCFTHPHESNEEHDLEDGEIADREEMASALHHMIDFSNSEDNLDTQSAKPVIMPIWSGNFNIVSKKNDITGLVAHLSNKACQRVYEAACQFEPVIHLEMLPKSNVWPKSFEATEPTGENIALYFFSSDISERDFGQLVDEMMRKELALKAVLQNAELLIFTSTELPLIYWRFQEKYYLWGVFRGKQSRPSNALSRVGSSDNSVTQTGLNGDNVSSTVKINGAQSPLSTLSNSGSYGYGTS